MMSTNKGNSFISLFIVKYWMIDIKPKEDRKENYTFTILAPKEVLGEIVLNLCT